MNKELLDRAIERSGLTKQHIAKELGMSMTSLWRKSNGDCEFTAKEISGMAKLLNLSRKETMDIFGL